MNRHKVQRGQTLVIATVVLAFLFVPLAVLVVDIGLVHASYTQLGETLQAASENAASMIDEGAYRADSNQLVLDPGAARRVADESMRASQVPGLQPWQVTVTGQTVAISATVRIDLLVVGATSISETRRASLAYGQ